VPGWWSGNAPNDQLSPQWPGGHGNLGLAHGIAGPLALLSTAMRRGITVTGQRNAAGRICAWLDQWRTDSGARGMVAGDGLLRPNGTPEPPGRLARDGRRGVTAPHGLARGHSNSPLWRWPTRDGSGSPSKPSPGALPMSDNSPSSATPHCATAGPDSFRSPGGWPPRWRSRTVCRTASAPMHGTAPATDMDRQSRKDSWTAWRACSLPGTPSERASRPSPDGMPVCCWTADVPELPARPHKINERRTARRVASPARRAFTEGNHERHHHHLARGAARQDG